MRRIFYRFWKTFFQSDRIFGGKSISAIKTVLETITWPPANLTSFFYAWRQGSHQLQICSHVMQNITNLPPQNTQMHEKSIV